MMRIALIGFGEVGAILADDLAARDVALSAWDIEFSDNPVRAVASQRVRKAASSADAVSGAALVISAVTAAQTKNAAADAALAIESSAYFFDLNSASPSAKRAAAERINAAGGHYVEAAVMAPIAPARIATSMLLGGPHGEAALPLLRKLGFVGATVFSQEYGKPAAAKLCRSVVVKGMEALLAESLIAARHYGVEDAVLASLCNLFPTSDWTTLSRYMIARAIEHGERRAEEMREATVTVADAGLTPWLSEAVALRQDWAADHAAALQHEDLKAMLDAIRAVAREAQP